MQAVRDFVTMVQARMKILRQWMRRRMREFQSQNGRLTISDRRARIRLYNRLIIVAIVGVVGLVLSTVIVFAFFAKDLPSPNKLSTRDVALSTQILERNGNLLYSVYGDQDRKLVTLDQVPQHLRDATIAIEDKDFYTHQGFSVRGWARAIYKIVVERSLQGGSTLTQQLVKSTLLTPERTLTRKLREFILAIQVEKKYSKDEILQMYLNEVPYGGTAWGVESAAQTYFGKHVWELNLAESALLAGLPQRPSVYSPFGSQPELAKDRQKQVLRRMEEDGYITKEEEESAAAEDLKFAAQSKGIKAPHFVMYVRSKLVEQFGETMVEQGGLKVTTTLDLPIQEAAQEQVTTQVSKLVNLRVGNGAAVVMDPKTGEILAMVGSKNYFDEEGDGNVNVTTSPRQPGSAIKPITYAVALQKGYTLSTVLIDAQTEFPGGEGQPPYIPQNYDGKFRGPIQMRYALANSVNVPAVKMLGLVGVSALMEQAREMGITTFTDPNRYGLSLTLGGGEVRLVELTNAFGTFANKGMHQDVVTILKVEDPKGRVLFEHKKTNGKRVLPEEVAFLISDVLRDNDARSQVFGTRSVLNIPGKTVAVKTGTTDDKKDNWTVGYTPSYVVGVWVGNNDGKPMHPNLASGITGAAPIWNGIMTHVLKDKKDEPFEMPSSIVQKDVDVLSGYAAHDGYASRKEYFIKSTEPQDGVDPIHTKVLVCRDNGKLATEYHRSKGLADEREFYVLSEQDPVSGDGRNRWQEGIDAWIQGNGDPKYHPPKENCDIYSSEGVYVRLLYPGDKEQVNTREFTIRVEVLSPKEITKVVFIIDGEEKQTVTNQPYEYPVTLTDGTHEIKVRGYDTDGRSGEGVVKIGVMVPWDYSSESTESAVPSFAMTP